MITGGAGFIGTAVCEALLKNNYKVVLVDHLQSSYSNRDKIGRIIKLKRFKNLIFLDTHFQDSKKVGQAVRRNNVSAVIHLAGQTSVPLSFQKPEITLQVNFIEAEAFFRLLVAGGVRRILFASSALVYGNNKSGALLSETNLDLVPKSPYALSLLCLEYLSQIICRHKEVAMTALRFFPTYGPSMRKDLFIPRAFNAAVNSSVLPLYCQGRTRRSYCYISELAEGIINALKYTNLGFSVFNLGHKESYSHLDLIKLIEILTKKKIKIKYLNQTGLYLDNLKPDVTKTEKLLGWKPEISLEDGLAQYFRCL